MRTTRLTGGRRRKTAQGWQVEATILLKEDAGLFNSAVEKMRLASDKFGDASGSRSVGSTSRASPRLTKASAWSPGSGPTAASLTWTPRRSPSPAAVPGPRSSTR
ncbi:hypothetical protein NKG94_34485 [Micromonospora sp. M12]